MRFKGILKVAIQLLNRIEIKLLLLRVVENVPWQVVDIPELVNPNVGEFKSYRSIVLWERCDEKIGTKGECCCY